MKQTALSIEQMKHLESLGLDTSDASMVYTYVGIATLKDPSYYMLEVNRYNNSNKDIPAYTLQDILEKLDKIRDFEIHFNISSHTIKAIIYDFEGCKEALKSFTKDSLLEAAYQTLLWCIENNYIKTNKV